MKSRQQQQLQLRQVYRDLQIGKSMQHPMEGGSPGFLFSLPQFLAADEKLFTGAFFFS
jgi:hypothetical protein